MSPVQSTTVRYGRPRRSQDVFGVGGQFLQLVVALFRAGELHQLHLLELVLPDDAAHVAPVGAGLAAEARRVGAEPHRAGVPRRASRRGRGWSPAPPPWGSARGRCLSHLEQVLRELGQLPGSEQAGGVHQERRQHLGVAVLARMHVEHEVDQRALEARAQRPSRRRSGRP